MGEGGDFRGRRVLITASSGGIGRHVALAFGEHGADVAVNFHTHADAGEAVADAVRALGVRAVALGADCVDPAAARCLVARAAEALGGLEILINNVGEFANKALRDHAIEDFQRILDGTVGATFHATMAALPHMRQAGWGRVVNLGATGADAALGAWHQGPHMAGKAAVVSLTRTFALEEARRGITFNVVSPGVVKDRELTREEAARVRDRRNPVGRPGTSQDVVDAILFLCRPDSSFINGAVLTVSGGWQGNLGAPVRLGGGQ